MSWDEGSGFVELSVWKDCPGSSPKQTVRLATKDAEKIGNAFNLGVKLAGKAPPLAQSEEPKR